MGKAKENNLVVILLVVIIIILIIGVVFLFFRYEKLEDKYERVLESSYDIDFDDNEITRVSPPNKTTNKPTATVKYITREKALQIALKDMKLSSDDVYDIEVEFESKTTHGNYVYEVTFDYEAYEYEYFIDAKTGKILSSFKSRD